MLPDKVVPVFPGNTSCPKKDGNITRDPGSAHGL